MAATAESSASDVLWRLVALVLGLLIISFMFVKWSDEFSRLMSGEPAMENPIAAQTPVAEVNPELAACLEKRLGDVQNMMEEGIISDSQFESFSSRASELCRAQHPSE